MARAANLIRSIAGWSPKLQDIRVDRKRLKRKLLGIRPAVINTRNFRASRPDLSVASDSLGREISSICRHDKLDSPSYRHWLECLGYPWRPHRKLWELAYICQSLHERGMLQPGKRGLGFAVGSELLPAWFASRGVSILASDLPTEDSRNRDWASTGQWAAGLDALRQPQLCDNHVFDQNVRFQSIDMNAIPNDLHDFDFTWSTCSFEHCGSIELGLKFLRDQMKCLAPDGFAIHTTEFNLSSNERTNQHGGCVIFRLQDIERVFTELENDGHSVEPICLDPGDHELDRHIDLPPYPQEKHLRLELSGFAATSIGLIIRKCAG